MRVLSLHPATTELMFAIGAGDLLVGRTDSCTYPEQAQKVPSIGPLEEVSDVLVEVFEPKLVLTGYGEKVLAEQLSSYEVFHFEPNTLEELFSSITSLAERLGKQVEADMVIHDLRIVMEKLHKRVEKYKRLRVYTEVRHAPPTAASGYIAELISVAGGTAFEGEPTVEDLEKFDPQAIISCVVSEDEFDFELLTARDGWKDLNAVQHERLYSIPGVLLHHPGPRLVQGIKMVAKLLHGIDINENES